MSLVDINVLIRTYLLTSCVLTDPLIALIGGAGDERMYQGRLPEDVTLPAVSFITRGGSADPNVPKYTIPSVQFDCWAEDVEGPPFVSGAITARKIYRALYDALAGLVSVPVTVDAVEYYIMKAREEVHGQDLMDEIPGYFRVISFYSITIRGI